MSESGKIDWGALRKQALIAVRRNYRTANDELIEDLSQTALMELFDAVESGGIRNAEALLNTICSRVCIDHRRRKCNQLTGPLPVGPDGEELDISDPGQDVDPFTIDVDMLELFRLVVCEFFEGSGHGNCQKLARHYYVEMSWVKVAEDWGVSHAKVRQDWSRCVAKLKAAFERRTGPLWDWVRTAGLLEVVS